MTREGAKARIALLNESEKAVLEDMIRQIQEHSIKDINLINYWLKPFKLKLNVTIEDTPGGARERGSL